MESSAPLFRYFTNHSPPSPTISSSTFPFSERCIISVFVLCFPTPVFVFPGFVDHNISCLCIQGVTSCAHMYCISTERHKIGPAWVSSRRHSQRQFICGGEKSSSATTATNTIGLPPVPLGEKGPAANHSCQYQWVRRDSSKTTAASTSG